MNDEIHVPLFHEYPLKLGKAFLYILKADHELDTACHTGAVNPNGFREQSPLGKEVGFDEIHWWVFKKENNINELRERTKRTLEYIQKLKEAGARKAKDIRGIDICPIRVCRITSGMRRQLL